MSIGTIAGIFVTGVAVGAIVGLVVYEIYFLLFRGDSDDHKGNDMP